jgi:hypothetical protein
MRKKKEIDDKSKGTTEESEKDEKHNDNNKGGEEEEIRDLSELSERERKFVELKLKLNKARKTNRREVATEHKRLNKGGKKEKSRHKEQQEKRENWRQEMIDIGEDPDKPYLYEPAGIVEMREEKKRNKRNPEDYGHDADSTQYRYFEKRLEKVKSAPSDNNSVQIRDANSLNYVIAARPNEQNIDRMIQELSDTHKRTAKFSRRRPYNEDADVNFINERNRIFNKKIKRAYDKYTVEIKNSLERGTAL